jgi:hypothetical protein
VPHPTDCENNVNIDQHRNEDDLGPSKTKKPSTMLLSGERSKVDLGSCSSLGASDDDDDDADDDDGSDDDDDDQQKEDPQVSCSPSGTTLPIQGSDHVSV